MTSVIVLGVTSSLSAAVLKRLGNSSIYGFVRPLDPSQKLSEMKQSYRDSLKKDNVSFIDYDGSDNDLQSKLSQFLDQRPNIKPKVLYLSTHVSTPILNFLRDSNVPTLAIGSGAATDWGMDRPGFSIVELSQNDNTREFAEYIEGKARAERVATVTIHPGFYLPDENCPFTYSGLHIESCEKIFAQSFDETFNWGKDKFVTPMGSLVHLIYVWTIACEYDYILNNTGGFSFGSYSAYPRWKLRELSGFDDVPQSIKDKYPYVCDDRYKSEMVRTSKAFDASVPTVKRACEQARNWVETHQEDYKKLH
jgi:hypothetical protein